VFIYDKQHKWCMAGDVVNLVYESGYTVARNLSKILRRKVENYIF